MTPAEQRIDVVFCVLLCVLVAITVVLAVAAIVLCFVEPWGTTTTICVNVPAEACK